MCELLAGSHRLRGAAAQAASVSCLSRPSFQTLPGQVVGESVQSNDVLISHPSTNRVRQAHAAQGEGTASLPCDDTIHVMRPSPPGREADAARDEEQRPSIGGMGATAPHPRDLLGSMNGDTLSARSLEGETETTNRAGILYSGMQHVWMTGITG